MGKIDPIQPAPRETEAKILRRLKAVEASGLPFGEIIIGPDGEIRILPKAEEAPKTTRTIKAW
jgi:hypothetical protein